MASLPPLMITFLYPLLHFSLLFSNSIGGEDPTKSQRKTYNIHVEKPANTVADAPVGIAKWYKSFLPATTAASSSKDKRMIHMYRHVASGFAARLTEEEVNEMSKKSGFVRARPSRTCWIFWPFILKGRVLYVLTYSYTHVNVSLGSGVSRCRFHDLKMRPQSIGRFLT